VYLWGNLVIDDDAKGFAEWSQSKTTEWFYSQLIPRIEKYNTKVVVYYMNQGERNTYLHDLMQNYNLKNPGHFIITQGGNNYGGLAKILQDNLPKPKFPEKFSFQFNEEDLGGLRELAQINLVDVNGNSVEMLDGKGNPVSKPVAQE